MATNPADYGIQKEQYVKSEKKFMVLVARRGTKATTVQMMSHADIQLMLVENRWGVVEVLPDMQDTIFDLHKVFEFDVYKNTNLETVVMVIQGHIVAPRLELVIPNPSQTKNS